MFVQLGIHGAILLCGRHCRAADLPQRRAKQSSRQSGQRVGMSAVLRTKRNVQK